MPCLLFLCPYCSQTGAQANKEILPLRTAWSPWNDTRSTQLNTQLTYDGDRFASEAQSPADADVLAATPSRPQPNGVLTAEEYHQHDLLQAHTHCGGHPRRPLGGDDPLYTHGLAPMSKKCQML